MYDGSCIYYTLTNPNLVKAFNDMYMYIVQSIHIYGRIP